MLSPNRWLTAWQQDRQDVESYLLMKQMFLRERSTTMKEKISGLAVLFAGKRSVCSREKAGEKNSYQSVSML